MCDLARSWPGKYYPQHAETPQYRDPRSQSDFDPDPDPEAVFGPGGTRGTVRGGELGLHTARLHASFCQLPITDYRLPITNADDRPAHASGARFQGHREPLDPVDCRSVSASFRKMRLAICPRRAQKFYRPAQAKSTQHTEKSRDLICPILKLENNPNLGCTPRLVCYRSMAIGRLERAEGSTGIQSLFSPREICSYAAPIRRD